MKRLTQLCATPLLFVCVAALAGEGGAKRLGEDSAKPQPDKPFQLTVELRDGSRLVGSPDMVSLSVRTSFGKLDVPFKLVEEIEVVDDQGTVKIHCANGDVLQGVPNLSSITLSTSFGRISIPLKHIVRVATIRGSVARGHVLYYSFDKDEGTRVSDQSGHENHGIRHGAVWTKDGAIGGAMSFDGQASIDLSELSCVENQYALSFGAWVYPTDHGLNGVMGKTISGSSVFFLNTHLQPSLLTFRCDVASQDQAEGRFIDVHKYMKLNAWQHLMGTYDGTRTKAYFNGSLVGQTEALKRKPTNANHARAAVGDVAFGRGWFFHGKIDEVMIFDCVLTSDEVRQLYNARNQTGEQDSEEDRRPETD